MSDYCLFHTLHFLCVGLSYAGGTLVAHVGHEALPGVRHSTVVVALQSCTLDFQASWMGSGGTLVAHVGQGALAACATRQLWLHCAAVHYNFKIPGWVQVLKCGFAARHARVPLV